jgi:hypothetical protein
LHGVRVKDVLMFRSKKNSRAPSARSRGQNGVFQPPAKAPERRRTGGKLRRWHQRIGLAAAVFVATLVVSGVALNHTEPLKLDSQPVRNALLLKWYGLKTVVPETGYAVGDTYLTWDAAKWALGGKILAEKNPVPVGAVQSGSALYVGTRSTLYVFQIDGQLIDKIEQSALPKTPIERLGTLEKEIAIGAGGESFASKDGLTWRGVASDGVTWSQPRQLPAQVRKTLEESFAAAVPLERVLLDLHSGRLFGRYGPWFVDLVAIGLVILALSGLWMYWRAWRRRRAPARLAE